MRLGFFLCFVFLAFKPFLSGLMLYGWDVQGQYGTWMMINDDTINGFGCGPNGPMVREQNVVVKQEERKSETTLAARQVLQHDLGAGNMRPERKTRSAQFLFCHVKRSVELVATVPNVSTDGHAGN
jgi:hypothetical protein